MTVSGTNGTVDAYVPVTMTCTAEGGSPPSTVNITRDGALIATGLSAASGEVALKPSENGTVFRCEAANEAGSVSTTVEFTVSGADN